MTEIKQTSLVDQVAEQIRANIQKDVWTIGMKLPSEKELALLFGVGRNTIREALKKSENIGLVKTYKGKGSYIYSNDPISYLLGKELEKEKIAEILEVRYILEEKGIILACKNRTEEDLLKLKELLNYRSTLNKFDSIDKEELVKIEYNFHMTVVESSHNNLLISIYKSIIYYIKETIYFTIDDIDKINIESTIHNCMYHAIMDSNKLMAQKSIQDHFRSHFDYLETKGIYL